MIISKLGGQRAPQNQSTYDWISMRALLKTINERNKAKA